MIAPTNLGATSGHEQIRTNAEYFVKTFPTLRQPIGLSRVHSVQFHSTKEQAGTIWCRAAARRQAAVPIRKEARRPATALHSTASLWLSIALAGVPLIAMSQTQSPPPFVVPSSGPSADATNAIPVSVRQSVELSHGVWRTSSGGGNYHPSLTYLKGSPVLMLVTTTHENAEKKLHRKGAIVQACGFLLDAPAFERAIICVVEIDPDKPNQQRVRNYPVQRGSFASAARKATKSEDLADALGKAKNDHGHAEKICVDLGIE